MKLKTGMTSKKTLADLEACAAMGTNVRCQVDRVKDPDLSAMRTRPIDQGPQVVNEKALIKTALLDELKKTRSACISKGDDDIIVAFEEEFEEVPLFLGLDMRNHSRQ